MTAESIGKDGGGRRRFIRTAVSAAGLALVYGEAARRIEHIEQLEVALGIADLAGFTP